MSADRIRVELDQLSYSANRLAGWHEQMFNDSDGPLRSGAFRDFDAGGALGRVHDNAVLAEFDRNVRLALATLEALLEAHKARLHHAVTALFFCHRGYVEVEQSLKAQIESYAADRYEYQLADVSGAAF